MRFPAMLTLAALILGFAGMASGADDPIKTRQALMKSIGPDLRAVIEMVKGETEFDGAVAQKAMQKVADDAKVLPTLFPPGSGVGSNALPLIWEEFDEFKAIYAKLQADAESGVKAAAANDLEGLKTAFSAVGDDCSACHQKYRAN